MPVPLSGLRARVERLLRGNLQAIDLAELFLYAREHTDGRQSVRDIGNFVAHHNERDQGFIYKNVCDWYVVCRFFIDQIKSKGQIDANNLPSNFDEVIRISFKRVNKEILQKINISRRELGKRLPALIRGLKRQPNGNFTLNPFYTRGETNIIAVLASNLVAQAAFDDEELYNDFSAILRSEGLLKKEETRDFKRLKDSIALFAVSRVHNSIVRIDDATLIKLSINNGGPDYRVGVGAPIPNSMEDGRIVNVSTEMFMTSIKASDGFNSELLQTPNPWDFDVELTSDGRLARLG